MAGLTPLIDAVMLAKNADRYIEDDRPEAPGVLKSPVGDLYAHPRFVQSVLVEAGMPAAEAYALAGRLTRRMIEAAI